MKHLYLHVGLHKTGTTSIQNTFFAERAPLAAAGIRYFGAAPNHSGTLIRAFAADPARFNRANRNGSPGRTPEGARERLAVFLDRAPPGTLVISGEGADRLDGDDVRRMLGFLRERVDRLTVIAFVRPPRSFMRSAAQQRVRGGLPLDRLADAWPRYRLKLRKFFQASDLGRVLTPIHHPLELRRGCSVATMLRVIGAPDALYDRLLVRRENASLSRPAVALMLAANEILPRRCADGSPNLARARGLFRLVEGWAGARFEIPDAVLDHALSEPMAWRHVAWAEQKLGRRFTEFEAPMPLVPPVGTPAPDEWARATLAHLLPEEAAALALHLRGVAAVLAAEPAALLGDAIAWIEHRLAWGAAEALDWAEMRALARLLNLAALAIRRPKTDVLDLEEILSPIAEDEPRG
jgi:hypothetical protein